MPGDVVKLSLGAVVAADVKLTGGEVLLDQSMLTGEIRTYRGRRGVQTYAGAIKNAMIGGGGHGDRRAHRIRPHR